MTDHAASTSFNDELAPKKPSRWRRYAFWGAAAVALTAAAVAALAPYAAGPGGLVLLAGIAASGLVLLYALAAGEAAARWLSPNAVVDAEPGAAAAAFELLSDPALIADRNGAPRRANAAYRELAAEADAMGESGRPPGFDRVLGGHPGVSSAIYRLARASRRRESLNESLPAASFGADGVVTAFDLEVTPLSTGETMWRARRRQFGDAEAPASGDPLLEDAPVGFFSAAPDGRVLYMNGTLRSWIGREAETEGLKVKDFIVGDTTRVLGKDKRRAGAAARAEVMLKAREGIETSAVVVTTWPKEGDRRKSSRSVVYALTASGAPVGVAQALAAPTTGEAGSMLDAMFANAPFGVARLDGGDVANAVIEDANPALLDITGGAAAPGRKFADLFALDATSRTALEEAGSSAERVQLTLANNQDRFVDVYFAPDRAGRKSAYVVEVSEQKHYEKLYLQAQKMQAVGVLASGVAHDMNNIFTAIQGNADTLLEAHPVGDPAYPKLQQIVQHVSRGAGLVRQLLAFSRRQTHRAELLDVSATLSDFSILLRQIIEENVKLDVKHGRDLPYVKADKGHLENAIINLATNARDAVRENGGGVISIRSARATHEEIKGVPDDEIVEGDYAMIEVADTGCGMDQETIQKIFEPFFTTKEVGKGTGLGLATVFGIVRQSGGHVTVESKKGQGTAFRIFLPAYQPTTDELDSVRAGAERLKEEPKPVSLNGRGRILFVEDEPGVRKISASNLRKRGYDVIEAEDGEEAFDILQDDPGGFDLLISDVIMPGMDGPTLLRKAREQLADAKIVFISGYAEDEFSDILSNEREVSFLPKPFTQPGLAEKVKSVIGGGDG